VKVLSIYLALIIIGQKNIEFKIKANGYIEDKQKMTQLTQWKIL
jgi:hypothetical protein